MTPQEEAQQRAVTMMVATAINSTPQHVVAFGVPPSEVAIVDVKQNDMVDVTLGDGTVYRVFVRRHQPAPVVAGVVIG